MAGKPTTGCRGCNACLKSLKCVRAKPYDPVNTWVEKSVEADGIILASPVYFANVSTEMKAYIDRAGWQIIFRNLIANKVGASIVTAQESGATSALDVVCYTRFSFSSFD